jgi:hypothetical protein
MENFSYQYTLFMGMLLSWQEEQVKKKRHSSTIIQFVDN